MLNKLKTIFRKPKKSEISMTKLMELVTLVKKLIDALGVARGEIAELKDKLLAAEVQAAADDKMIAELMAVIDSAMGEGASMGGNG